MDFVDHVRPLCALVLQVSEHVEAAQRATDPAERFVALYEARNHLDALRRAADDLAPLLHAETKTARPPAWPVFPKER